MDRPIPPRLPGVAGMFGEVYWFLGQPSRLHPQMTQSEVDACDVAVVAIYLGHRPVDPDDPLSGLTGDFEADSRLMIAQRMAEAAAEAVAD